VARVPAEDRRQVEQQIGGTIYRARDGWFDMPDHHAALHLQSANYGRWHIAGVPAPSSGYRCPACGFGSWFKICGRCKSQCVK
jgi:hypothetical protein